MGRKWIEQSWNEDGGVESCSEHRRKSVHCVHVGFGCSGWSLAGFGSAAHALPKCVSVSCFAIMFLYDDSHSCQT